MNSSPESSRKFSDFCSFWVNHFVRSLEFLNLYSCVNSRNSHTQPRIVTDESSRIA
uniref:Uncharacterized protein n=1 Tax=Helianthus annuus TaxID=4232 RepID=A0A251UH49_HELAN